MLKINEQDSMLVLNAMPGLGNTKIRSLIEHYGSASRVLSLDEEELKKTGLIQNRFIEGIVNFPKEEFLDSEKDLLEQQNVNVLTVEDEDYPKRLKEISDAPCVLYVWGDIPKDITLSIAIVGSRKATLYGTSTAQKFAAHLSEMGFTIISGLARGIDTSAHRGVIKASGETIAVLGSGLANIYPSENKELASVIANQGAVISEFPMTTKPMPFNFPRRNRIVSGLSLGVIIVEASQRSGALITADCALEQGRDVYAIPSKIDSPNAYGVNNLIKQGAKLITCLEDVLEDLKPHMRRYLETDDSGKPKGSPVSDKMEKLTEEEKIIFNQISDKPVHIDLLLSAGEDKILKTDSILLQLEMKQVIKQLPGKRYQRCING